MIRKRRTGMLGWEKLFIRGIVENFIPLWEWEAFVFSRMRDKEFAFWERN
jgi:hypothetical protein